MRNNSGKLPYVLLIVLLAVLVAMVLSYILSLLGIVDLEWPEPSPVERTALIIQEYRAKKQRPATLTQLAPLPRIAPFTAAEDEEAAAPVPGFSTEEAQFISALNTLMTRADHTSLTAIKKAPKQEANGSYSISYMFDSLSGLVTTCGPDEKLQSAIFTVSKKGSSPEVQQELDFCMTAAISVLEKSKYPALVNSLQPSLWTVPRMNYASGEKTQLFLNIAEDSVSLRLAPAETKTGNKTLLAVDKSVAATPVIKELYPDACEKVFLSKYGMPASSDERTPDDRGELVRASYADSEDGARLYYELYSSREGEIFQAVFEAFNFGLLTDEDMLKLAGKFFTTAATLKYDGAKTSAASKWVSKNIKKLTAGGVPSISIGDCRFSMQGDPSLYLKLTMVASGREEYLARVAKSVPTAATQGE